jgi:hypothetical protein
MRGGDALGFGKAGHRRSLTLELPDAAMASLECAQRTIARSKAAGPLAFNRRDKPDPLVAMLRNQVKTPKLNLGAD